MAVPATPLAQRSPFQIDDDVRPLLSEAALDCAQRLVAWANTHAPQYQLRLTDAAIHRWRSVEDPEWLEAVVDLAVVGAEADADRFWEAATEALAELAGPESTVPVDTLWVRVRRQ